MSDIAAVFSIALLLGSLNQHNEPSVRVLVLLASAMLAVLSYILNRRGK